MPQIKPTDEKHCKLHPNSMLYHASGWLWCDTCKKKVGKANHNNTNKQRGEGRDFEASGESHSMVAKGSHGMPRR
jgi:hypothetical protein